MTTIDPTTVAAPLIKPLKLKTLTFGAIHPIVRHPTPEQRTAVDDGEHPVLMEPGATMVFRARPYTLFQPSAIRLLVPPGDPNPLELLDVSYADPSAPEGQCYVSHKAPPDGGGFSLAAMRGHVMHTAEVFLARVHNPSKQAVLVRPVLIAADVGGHGANVVAMDRAIPLAPSTEPIVIAGDQWAVACEEAPFKCRPRILRIDSDSKFDVLVRDLKVGNRGQITNGSSIPIELFKDGFDLGSGVSLAEPYQDIAVTFMNAHKFDARRIFKIELDVEVYDRLDHIVAQPDAP
jgi:hypothetical protein